MSASHYHTLTAHLDTDIRDVLGYSAANQVFFGFPRVPNANPSATVLVTLERDNGPRYVDLNWTFGIELRFAPPVGSDLDGYLMDQAELVVQRLAPFDLDAPPATPQRYAGIGVKPHVTKIVPVLVPPADGYVAVQIEFTCMTTVYQ